MQCCLVHCLSMHLLMAYNYQFNNKSRKIQPQRLGKIKNSKPESNFYWFFKKECILKLILDFKAETTAENQNVIFKSLLMPFFIINFIGSYKKECILKLILDVKAETTAEKQRIMLKAVLTPFFIINFTGFDKKECIRKLILDFKAETTAENQRVMLKSLLTPFFIIKLNSLGGGMV